jgi:hypothetical protein
MIVYPDNVFETLMALDREGLIDFDDEDGSFEMDEDKFEAVQQRWAAAGLGTLADQRQPRSN